MSQESQTNILLVHDKVENLSSLETTLDQPDLNFVKAFSGAEARKLIPIHPFALMVMDYKMAESEGFETAQLMEGFTSAGCLPVLYLLEGGCDPAPLFEGTKAGTVDLLTEPLNPALVKHKVRHYVELYHLQRKHRMEVESLRSNILELRRSKIKMERKNKELNYQSVHDGLTGLYNRRHLDAVLEKEFARAERYNSDLACILLDLDFFKEVNDNCGHMFGDFVLQELAASMSGYVRETDYTFRYGGEEFMMLLPNTGINGAIETADKFRKICEDRVYDNEKNITMLTVSLGVSSLRYNKPVSPRDLVVFADKAMFQAKAEGRNRVVGYSVAQDNVKRASCKIKNLQERISFILEKSKRASIASLELLIRETGGGAYRENCKRVVQYIEMITANMNLPSELIKSMVRTAALHSCFNILLRDALQVDDITFGAADRDKIKKFPNMMNELTNQFDFFSDERSVLKSHREKYDGSGYPEGLKGDSIPIGARIFAIADAFTAMTSKRTYKKTLTREEAIQELMDNAGSQFDPELIPLFVYGLQQEKESA